MRQNCAKLIWISLISNNFYHLNSLDSIDLWIEENFSPSSTRMNRCNCIHWLVKECRPSQHEICETTLQESIAYSYLWIQFIPIPFHTENGLLLIRTKSPYDILDYTPHTPTFIHVCIEREESEILSSNKKCV